MRWVALLVAFACSKPGDPAPAHEDRRDPPVATSKLRLDIVIGGVTSTWTDAAFAAVPQLPGAASDGTARDTWSLRELVHKNAGPTARVTAIMSASGATPLDGAAWADPTRTPILHTTKRGALKFRWADAHGVWGDTVVRDVTGLEIAR